MERLTKFRSGILVLIVCLVLGFYSVRLYRLQVVETEGDKDNVTTYTSWTRVKAARGDILDRFGNVLVSNRASYDLVFNHIVLQCSDTPNQDLLELAKLCRSLGVKYIEHFPVTMERPFTYTLDSYSSMWREYFQTFLTQRAALDSDVTAPLLISRLRSFYGIPKDWTDEDARLVIGLRYELSLRAELTNLPTYVFLEDAADDVRMQILELNTPGLRVEASTVREYSTVCAAHILGNLGAMTEEQWEYYKELGYSMDAEVGQSGFEAAFEEYLHGTDGWRVDEFLSDGTIVSSTYLTEPKSGNNVEVTIDMGLQMLVEESLAAQMQYLSDPERNLRDGGQDAQGAAAVVMDVKTGQVLACASYPTFDLAHFSEKYQQIIESPNQPLFNRALLGTYPPGSVYKVSVAVAALEAGVINPDTQVKDEGVFTKYNGFSPACMLYNDVGATHGSINVKEALMVSCNYFFYTMGDMLTLEQIDSTAKALGLGEPTGVELYEETGYRSNPETKELLYTGDDSQWYQGDQVLTAIGQSENKFTPMQMCVYTATLANKGTRMRATFLNRVVSADYRSLLVENLPKVEYKLEISDLTYQTYLEGMQMVVYDYSGTLGGTVMEQYNKVRVAAKTGTADHSGAGSANGALICFAPVDDPEIAIALYGERIAHGPNLAPVAKDILDFYFNKEEEGDVPIYENRVG